MGADREWHAGRPGYSCEVLKVGLRGRCVWLKRGPCGEGSGPGPGPVWLPEVTGGHRWGREHIGGR